MQEDLFDKAAQLLKQAKNGVALTGAGVSTESGIPDFRGKDGLWSRYDPNEYGTMGSFLDKPEKVWHMLAALLEVVEAQPNEGHRGLAELEQMGLLHGIITQNIDGLHQKGGSRNVVEFHGSLDTFSCLSCGAQYGIELVKDNPLPPYCAVCHAILKPDIVFFDERIPEKALIMADEMLSSVDLLLVAGTSCQVQPAARIPFMAFNRGGKIIEINKEPALSHIATVTLQGSFSAAIRELVQRLRS